MRRDRRVLLEWLLPALMTLGAAWVRAADVAPVSNPEAPAPSQAEGQAPRLDVKFHFAAQVLGPDLKPVSKARAAMVRAPKEEGEPEGMGGLAGALRRGARSGAPMESKPAFFTATADAEGRFAIELPDAGPYNLRVEADGLAPIIVERVRASEKAPPPGPVYMQAGFAISGKVYDLSKRVPAEGASVRARGSVDHGFSDPDAPDRFAPAATTGRDGSFTLTHLAPNLYRLEALAPGYALVSVPNVTAEAAAREPVTIYLEPGLSVGGKVVDQQGKPVAGASVAAGRGVSARLDRGSLMALGSRRTRTDEQGRFRLEGLPRTDQLYLDARLADESRGRVSLPDPAGRAILPDVEIAIERPSRITGKLLDAAGQPVARAGLRVDFGESGPGRRRLSSFYVTADDLKIGAKGDFTVERVPSGTGTIEILPEGFKRHEIEDARLAPGETFDAGTITLDRGHTVRGRVTGEDGKGLAKAEVGSFSFGPGGFGETEARTDSEGHYLLGGLGEAPVSLTVSLEGYGREKAEQVPPDSEGINFVLRRAGSLTGRVVAGDKPVPVTSFSVRASPKTTSGAPFDAFFGEDRPFNDSRGRFTLRGLAAGDYSLEVRAPSFVPAMRDGVKVVAGESVDIGDVTLEAGVSVRGRVVDRDGAPVAGARVSLKPAGMFSIRFGAEEQATLSHLDGRFVLRGLAAGSQSLVAEHPDFARAEATTRTEPGVEGQEVVLTLGKGGRIAGTVRDERGSPQAGVGVMAMIPTDPMRSAPVQTDEQGLYAIENLPPGSYMVMTIPLGGGRGMAVSGVNSQQAEVKEGQTAVVNFGDEKAIRVYGTVRNSSGPMPRARLIWVPSRFETSMTGSIAMGTADESGLYEVKLQKAGKYTVRVSGPDEGLTGGAGLEVEVPEGTESKQDIVLSEGRISGIVLSAADNKPLGGATVTAFHLPGDGDGSSAEQTAGGSTMVIGGRGRARSIQQGFAGSATADSTGSYTIDNLSPGGYKVSASKEGFASRTIDKVVVGDTGIGAADFYLTTGRKIHARVLDADGRPLAQAFLILLDAEGNPIVKPGQLLMTGSDGTSTIDGVDEGTYGLLVLTRDLAPTVAQGIDVTREADGAAQARATPGGSLTVKVVDGEGRPLSGVTMDIKDPSGVDLTPILPLLRLTSGLPSATGSDGMITFPHLSAGKHEVTANLEGGGAISGSIEIVEGKASTLTLKVKSP